MKKKLEDIFEAIESHNDTYELENEISENIDKFIDISDFFNLPIKSIYNIISYANKINYDTAYKLIQKAFEKYGSEAIILLGNLKLIESNPIKCFKIIQLIKSSTIFLELANSIKYDENSLYISSSISQNELKELIETKNNYEKQIKELNMEIKQIKDEYATKESNLQKTITQLKEENENLVKNMQKSQVTILTLQNQINDYEKQNVQLQQQTKQQLDINYLNTLPQNLENLPKDTIIQKLKEQISTLVIELKKAKKEVDDMKSKNGEYNVDDLQKMLQTVKKKNYKYKLKIKELKKSLRKYNSSPSKSDEGSQSDIDNQSPSSSLPQVEYSLLNPQSEEINGQIDSLQKEIEEVKNQNSLLIQENKELQEQNQKLQQDVDTNKTENEN